MIDLDLLAEAAGAAAKLLSATNSLELASPGERTAEWHKLACALADSIQLALGDASGLTDSEGWKNSLGESLWAGTASPDECRQAAAIAKESGNG